MGDLALHREPLAEMTVPRTDTAKITLCGSTRFRNEYELWNNRLTLAGFLVYSVSGFGHSGDTFTDEEKSRLDQIHLAKIDASHAIVVINPGGYIGDSTRREIEHAERDGKLVYYTGPGRTVYQLRTGPDGPSSLRYRAFDWTPTTPATPESGGDEPLAANGLKALDAAEVVVPREPTEAMIAAVIEGQCITGGSTFDEQDRRDIACDVYHAMIQAAEQEGRA